MAQMADAPRVDAVLLQFQQTVDSYRNFLASPPDASALGLAIDDFNAERISLLTREISQRSTQFHLSFLGDAKFDDCAPFANLLAKDLLNLVSLSLIPATSPAFCKAFRRQFRDGVEAILEATSSLAAAYLKARKAKSPASAAPQTGKVWQACKQYAALPLLNQLAAQAGIARWLPLIKDTTQELQELLDQPQPGGSGDDGDDEDDEDWDDEPLSADERRAIPGCITLLKCSYNMLRKLNTLLGSTALTPRHKDTDVVEWLDGVFDAVEALSREVDDFGSSCHAPQTFALLESNARAVRSSNEALQQLVVDGLQRFAGGIDEDSKVFLALLRDKLAESMQQILAASPTEPATERDLSSLKLQ
eukprot:TRINITY_DN2127_c0_g1_i1.p1 TRINITY_DN2127_c0_g1~~TRINITY_DN2127_c0_g1_i1.p1  ORF type:complete len:362 (+),score=121.21 TRINITY_DN2127_c0_g1_i1:1094-2179(+)